jgi:DMSO/TMAO reductase YedYZ molybdopterin-dependent catalytic subunit
MIATRRVVLRALPLALALAAAASASAQTAAALAVSGRVNSPRRFTLAELQALPWTTREESAASGAPRATWVGVSLWTLLDQSGGVAVPPAEFARHRVVVKSAGGRRATLSLAAVAPGGGADALVAWSRDDGPYDPRRGLRLVVPGDPRNLDLAGVTEIVVR